MTRSIARARSLLEILLPPLAVLTLAVLLTWGLTSYASAQGEAAGRAAVAAEMDAGADVAAEVVAPAPAPDPSPALVVASDPGSDPGGAIDLVASLFRRGYAAAGVHLLLFWGGLLALSRSGWLVARAPWLARGRVLVAVSGVVAHLAVTLPGAVEGSSTWRGIVTALGAGLLLWLRPEPAKVAEPAEVA